MRDRLRRLRALMGLGGKLTIQRLRYTAPRRTAITIVGVAFAIGLALTVSGVSVAVADQGSVVSSNVDYWIVPQSESSSTLPVSVGGPEFGDVHSVATDLSSRPDITYASPVSLKLLQLSHGNSSEYVLVAGVVAHQDLTVAGVDASNLTPGDPYYANGSYNGQWTGEIILSNGASKLLNAPASTQVSVPNQTAGTTRTFNVTAVTQGGESGMGQIPVAVVHLAELQSLTGGTASDTADQILVSTNSPQVRSNLAGLYPQSQVITRGSSFSAVSNSQLALALAAAGLIVSLVVGILFVATTIGLEITTERRVWATLSAVGFSTRSRALLLFLQTITLTLLGAVLGALLGRLGVLAANTALASVIDNQTVAVYPIEFIGFGFILATTVAILTTPYLVWLTARGSITDTLSQ